jgi:hypothetical protein
VLHLLLHDGLHPRQVLLGQLDHQLVVDLQGQMRRQQSLPVVCSAAELKRINELMNLINAFFSFLVPYRRHWRNSPAIPPPSSWRC